MKISKTCTLMGYFRPKYIVFELKKYIAAIFDGTEDWFRIWWWTDLCFQKWHVEFRKFLQAEKIAISYLKNDALDCLLLVLKLYPIQVFISLSLWIKLTMSQLLISFLCKFCNFFSNLGVVVVTSQPFFIVIDW